MVGTPRPKKASETAARWLVVILLVSIPLVILGVRWLAFSPSGERVVEIHAKMPENGGWSPTDLTVEVGNPLHLRLISDDVVHGFAIGQSDQPAIDLMPGKTVETTLVFDQPGKYTYYCTRWCGINHWRMRGTIEVKDPGKVETSSEQIGSEEVTQPLFVTLGLDIDAPHPADNLSSSRPSAWRGASLEVDLPENISGDAYYLSHSPSEIWFDLRLNPSYQDLNDGQVWDLVALNWKMNTSKERLTTGSALYSENCAACHGVQGAGNGVMAKPDDNQAIDGYSTVAPSDFTNNSQMLGASPALLMGKIIRGGMGTGMPYWGPIFTDEQIRSLVDYLWTFQFETEVNP